MNNLDKQYRAYSKYMTLSINNGYNLSIESLKSNEYGFSPYSKEEFINKIKTDSEFSERWGFQLYTRELSESELWDYIHKNKIEIKHQHAVLYGHPIGSELRNSFIPTLKEKYNIPTKLLTITYKDKTIEVYE